MGMELANTYLQAARQLGSGTGRQVGRRAELELYSYSGTVLKCIVAECCTADV